MSLSEAQERHAAAVEALATARQRVDAFGERKGACVMAIVQTERDLAEMVEDAADTLTPKSPLLVKLLDAYGRERTRLEFLDAIQKRLSLDVAAAKLTVAEAAVDEAELAVLVIGEQLQGHLRAQGEAAKELVRLEGSDVNLQIEGLASAKLRSDLEAALERAEGARRAAEAEVVAFEAAKLQGAAGRRRVTR